MAGRKSEAAERGSEKGNEREMTLTKHAREQPLLTIRASSLLNNLFLDCK
jgi:hypothetical protein